MTKQLLRIGLLSCIMMLSLSGLARASGPLWSLIPLTEVRYTLSPTETADVRYQLTNHTNTSRALRSKPIRGVTQITTGAGRCAALAILRAATNCGFP